MALNVLPTHVRLDQRSYSTLGPVSARVGDRYVRINRLSKEPGTQAYSASARPVWVGWYEYPAKAGEVNWHIV